jgi:hypothetical protein
VSELGTASATNASAEPIARTPFSASSSKECASRLKALGKRLLDSGFAFNVAIAFRQQTSRLFLFACSAADHRLDEPTWLSLGMVASLQSPLPFHLAKSL